MAKGNEIIVTAHPGGRFLTGYVSGTPKPGTCMQIKAATALRFGRPTFEAFNQAADGTVAMVAVLLTKDKVGGLNTDAYIDGEMCEVYCPQMGDELNVLKGDVAGTGDDFAIGDRLMIDDGTGKVIADSSGASVPFVCMEDITDPEADQLVHVTYTGY